MKLEIAEDVFSLVPDLVVGTLLVKGVRGEETPAEIKSELEATAAKLRQDIDLENLSSHPVISRWREIYRSFGVKPGDARSSIEALWRRVLNGKPITTGNCLVDVYNLISIACGLPFGGQDVDSLRGKVRLIRATGAEKAVQVLGDESPEVPKPGEIIYIDDEGVTCRRFNWREVSRVGLSSQTKDALFVAEGVGVDARQTVQAALARLSQELKKYFPGCDVTIDLLEK